MNAQPEPMCLEAVLATHLRRDGLSLSLQGFEGEIINNFKS